MIPAHKPLIIGHRGAAALAPENTLESIELAFAKLGADMVEFDVRTTKDGVPVIIHDATLDRTTNGKDYLYSYTLKEVKKLDAAYRFDPDKNGSFPFRAKGLRIPTFEELLERFSPHPNPLPLAGEESPMISPLPQGEALSERSFQLLPQSTRAKARGGRVREISFAVEIKENSKELTRKVVEFIEKYGFEKKVVVGSKHEEVAAEMRRNFPNILRFTSQTEVAKISLERRANASSPKPEPMAVASLPLRKFQCHLESREMIDHLHKKKMRVFYWTINDKSKMLELAQKGADGIITDNPAVAYEVFRR